MTLLSKLTVLTIISSIIGYVVFCPLLGEYENYSFNHPNWEQKAWLLLLIFQGFCYAIIFGVVVKRHYRRG